MWYHLALAMPATTAAQEEGLYGYGLEKMIHHT